MESVWKLQKIALTMVSFADETMEFHPLNPSWPDCDIFVDVVNVDG